MKYNFEEYIELLKYDQALKKNNKSLISEDPKKYSKLINYLAQMCDYFHWSQKDDYLELIKNFLNFKIDGKEFDNRFSLMVQEIEKKVNLLSHNELKHIQPNSNSIGFGKWISEINLCCNEFYPDFNEAKDREEIPFGKTEEQLRQSVNNLLPEIEKYF